MKQKKEGKNKCSICGTRGHTARTCEGSPGLLPKSGSRFAKKPCCGSTGTRHFKTCSLNGAKPTAKPRTELERGVPLTEQAYDQIRDAMHDRDFSTLTYSVNHKSRPREINAAVRSANYDDYLVSR